ncbi:alpha/beta fold hydrolase [Halobacillus litoralis]|uniref:Lipase n=1 Tax=Halobacillus litoralis TaxID=45668 RepID=A0A410MD37_9BACI|nr:alpha/beta hydrolase [Halobacillus litoralis]QAS52617.1 lipase [Halobacillus litoralis]
MERYFLKVGKSQVHVTVWGHERNPVIFCLHGLGSTSLSFIEVAEELEEEYRIISIDAPGHGKTMPFLLESSYEMPSMADWLDEVVRELGLERFFFLSHSWGSFLALFYLAKHSEKVRGTILLDGGYQTKRLSAMSLEDELAYYENDFDGYQFNTWHDFFDSEKAAYKRWSSLLERAVKDLGKENEGRVSWHASGETAKNFIKAMHKNETETIYSQLPPSIVLLRATLPVDQERVRKHTAETFEVRANAKVEAVPSTTHMLHWDKPEVVIEAIRSNWGKRLSK